MSAVDEKLFALLSVKSGKEIERHDDGRVGLRDGESNYQRPLVDGEKKALEGIVFS